MWLLDIPYSDKTSRLLALKQGAWWSDEFKSWYLPDRVFKWYASSTVYAPFYEVYSVTKCWNCHNLTPVITLGVYQADEDNKKHGMVLSHSENVILCNKMQQLPDDLIRHFCQYDFFGRTSTFSRGSYWGPICEKCKAVQGEFYLYRHGGAFNSDSDSGTITGNKRVEIIKGFEGKHYISASFTADDAFCRPK